MNALQQSLIFVAILAGIFLLGSLIYYLTPVLLPFLIAATLAYLLDPLVELLNRKWRIPRTLSVVGVFLWVAVIFLFTIVFLVPALQRQISILIARIPQAIEWAQQLLVPKLIALGLAPEDLGLETLKGAALSHWSQTTKIAGWMGQTLFHSGLALVAWLMNFMIIIVATFYFLRDWPALLTALKSLLPSRMAPTIIRLAQQCDGVLATFMRGQLSVMLCLAVIYTLGLALIGVNFSLLLGMMAGFLSIVPYLGGIIGLVSALIIAYLQFHAWFPIGAVCVLFGIGHILEGMVLAPLLIGDKLGLHPIAVIFAVLAGGQLFGFVGVLLAIPVAAMLVVLLREALAHFSAPAPVAPSFPPQGSA